MTKSDSPPISISSGASQSSLTSNSSTKSSDSSMISSDSKSSKSSASSWFQRKKEKIEKALHHTHSSSHSSSDDNSSLPEKSLKPAVDSLSIQQAPVDSDPDLAAQSMLSLDIFPKNTPRIVRLDLPKIGQRIEDIIQLAHCARLLCILETPASPLSPLVSFLSPSLDATVSSLSQVDMDWLKTVESKSVERDMIFQLLIGIVREFISDPVKDPESIREIVLVGPVLQRSHFRSLLTSFVADLIADPLLNVDKLQGLTQLIQDAPPGYIEADDLINVLDAISKRLQSTAPKSEDFSFHLAVAVSKVLGVMADQNIEGLDRVLQHDPLGKALSGLKSHNNPFLTYQAIYGSQALSWVPNNESQMQRSLRLFAGMASGLIKVSGVMQLNFNGFLGGLQDIQAAVEETVDIVKAGVEDFHAMIEDGRELAECLKGAFGSKQKGLWYLTLRAAQELIRHGQLADFNTLVREAPSHKGYMFQWGICQLLGDIAVDPTWDETTRRQAIRFLGEMFATTSLTNVRQWILTILNHISTSPIQNPSLDIAVEETIKTQASVAIQSLAKKSQEEAFPFPYLLGQRLPLPLGSVLLRRVNKTADLEPKILKIQSGICENKLGFYVPLMSKASQQDSGDKLDPLEDRVTSFLNAKREIMLILGDSGSGKSTYNRQLERSLWDKYRPGGAIPLLIELKTMGRLDDGNIVKRTLDHYGFTDIEIQELKEHRRVILICDGYDECRQWVHLHTRIKDERWKLFQIVVSCRIQYLTPTYRNYFVPRPAANQSASEASSLFEEAFIVPFKSEQIESFVNQFRETMEVKNAFVDQPVWSTDTYMTYLSGLTEMVTNPFTLKLILITLPSVVGNNNDFSGTATTRFNLYRAFITQYLEEELRRLGDTRMGMSEAEVEALEEIETDFVIHGIHFSMRLAHAVFIEQGGVNAIEYSAADGRGWKARFFSPKATADVKLLRQSSQLKRHTPVEANSLSLSASIGPKKTIFSFSHRSILEYFYSCRLCDFVQDLRELDPASDEAQYSDISACVDPSSDISLLAAHPLNKKSIVSEPSVVHFLVEYTNSNSQFKGQLHTIVNLSKTEESVSQASANAMTVLVQAGVQFNRSDLRGVKIPSADLSGGHFDYAQFQDADMTGVNLSKAWLRGVDFGNARMKNMQFGEKPFLKVPGACSMALSPDKKYLVLGFENGELKLLDTTDWSTIRTQRGHTDRVECTIFSSTGNRIVSGSKDSTIRVWNLQEESDSFVLQGHTDEVTSVAISPNGLQLVSGSKDMTARVWDLDSRSFIFVLASHMDKVRAVAWSPNGHHIATGSKDNTVRMWEASSGTAGAELSLMSQQAWSLLFIPDSQRLIVGTDSNILIWDLDAEDDPVTLKGHNSDIRSLDISADRKWILSASDDRTVSIWSEQTGRQVHTFSGHSKVVLGAAFLNDREAISLANDETVRVWELSNDTNHVDTLQKQLHTGPVLNVKYSPDGKFILSCGYDPTVREWDAETGTAGAIINDPRKLRYAEYSPDGKQIATRTEGNELRLVDRATDNHEAESKPDPDSVTALTYSPCGRRLVTGASDGEINIWDLMSGAELHSLEGHTSHIKGLIFAPNGLQLVSYSFDCSTRVWDMSDDMCKATLAETLEIDTAALVYSPCGTMMAWSDSPQHDIDEGDGEEALREGLPSDIHLRDTKSGQELFALKGHRGPPACLAWSSQGILSGGLDSTVRLWMSQSVDSVITWTCMAVIQDTMGPVYGIAWNPLVPLEFASGDLLSSVYVWKITEEGSSEMDVRLKWGSTHRLLTKDVKITDAVDLDNMTRMLLQQGGATDEKFVYSAAAAAAAGLKEGESEE